MHLADFTAMEVPDIVGNIREHGERRGDGMDHVRHIFRMNHLGGHLSIDRTQSEFGEHVGFEADRVLRDEKRQRIVGADRTRQLAAEVRAGLFDLFDAVPDARHVVGQGIPERHRRGVLPVRASHLDRLGVCPCESDQETFKSDEVGKDEIAREFFQGEGRWPCR